MVPMARDILRLLLPLALLAGCAPAGTVPAGSSAPGMAAQPDGFALPALPAPRPISAEEHARRRAALYEGMGEGVLVALGAAEPELDYLPFGQDANFRYLTGITEAGAALVAVKRGGTVEEQLFVLPRNPEREVWEGARLGAEGAQRLTGLPARTVDQLVPLLDTQLRGGGTLYTLTAPGASEDPLAHLGAAQQVTAQLVARYPGVRLVPLNEQLARIRATKSPVELDLIRRAVLISTLAHRAAMRATAPGMNEFEIHALVEHYFRRHGAAGPAYGSIVGSGPNSTTLHYRDADRFMQAGEVLLMDVGASFRGYAADVTRTVPVNGTFSADQRAIYEIVLGAQKAAEALVRPGATWQQLNEAANTVIADGLARLGLIESPTATYRCESPQFGNACPQYRIFYMHGLGHGVGLNVHDPDVSYYGAFAVGSAFTIEPGIYVRADALDYLQDTPENRAMIARLRPAVQRYRNIGVRVEDVYLITEQGVERASQGVPREIAEIEALMRLPGTGEADRRPEVVEWYRATERR
jgi:Xaa-Pro aminopeptidase